MIEDSVIDDPHYATPLYRKAEAAHIKRHSSRDLVLVAAGRHWRAINSRGRCRGFRLNPPEVNYCQRSWQRLRGDIWF
jgi:hypothetical protein